VHDAIHLRQGGLRLAQGRQYAVGLIIRCAGDLGDTHAARAIIYEDEVGKGSADVYPDRYRHASTLRHARVVSAGNRDDVAEIMGFVLR